MYNISYMNPYATRDAVSLDITYFLEKLIMENLMLPLFKVNSNGFGAQFGYPISDISRLGFNITYDKTDIDIGTLPAREIYDFVSVEGNIFETLTAQLSWQQVTLNRGLFPTDGASTVISFSSTIPGSDLCSLQI